MSLELFVPENWLLRNHREKLDLSQEEVANKAGIRVEQYQNFESGNRDLSSSTFRIVHAVLAALELDTMAFYKGEYVFESLPEANPLNEILSQI